MLRSSTQHYPHFSSADTHAPVVSTVWSAYASLPPPPHRAPQACLGYHATCLVKAGKRASSIDSVSTGEDNRACPLDPWRCIHTHPYTHIEMYTYLDLIDEKGSLTQSDM